LKTQNQNILVVTGGRADFGLLSRICKFIDDDLRANLIVAVTGYHFSTAHGNTVEHVRSQNYSEIIEVELDLNLDDVYSTSNYISKALLKFTDLFKSRQIDKVLVLGDRYEILGVCIAANLVQIPIAHIGGGEVTAGAFDDFIRHSITKMASIHFTGHPDYKRRVIQLGESPDTVFDVGSPGAENIESMKNELLSKTECENMLGLSLKRQSFFVTFHPETRYLEQTIKHFEEILSALSEFEDTNIIFSMPNADSSFQKIIEMIDNFVLQKPHFRYAFSSLGQHTYFSLLQFIDVVIGNSSSGILEVPSFKIGTINIGDRQTGRVRAASVLDVDPVKSQIICAIDIAVSNEFRSKIEDMQNPFFKPHTAQKIADCLISLSCSVSDKKFFDLPAKVISS
jgi:GDP/UDP-N,N'-diacetylbacillosamine 2-epimerase (hydrolysing)